MMRCQECRVLHNTPQEASDCRYRDLLKAEARRAAIAECVAVLEARYSKGWDSGIAEAINIIRGLQP